MTFTPEEFARVQRGIHGPAWRIHTATPCETRPGTPSALHDNVVLNFIKFRQLRGEAGEGIERASAAYPAIAAAERLNEDQETTARLKLMILVDMSDDEMCDRSGIDLITSRTWESLYFDVRGQRQATCWLASHVINHERNTGDPWLASKMKLAIIAGPVAVRAMLDTAEGIQLDEADRLFQRKITLSGKLDVAVEMPFDSEENRLRFVKLHLDLMFAEKRIALAERRLAQRCAEALQRHELAKMRLVRAAERAAGDLKDNDGQAGERKGPRRRRQVARAAAGTSRQTAIQEAAVRQVAASPQLRGATKRSIDPAIESQVDCAVEQAAPPLPDALKSVAVDAKDEGTMDSSSESLIPAA